MDMKTTLNLNDSLLRRAKKTAAERGISLTRLVEDALEMHLRSRGSKRYQFKWVVVKDDAPAAVDVADRRALYDFLDGL
jgi:hypothetical protein